jgi:DNA replication protein DnaC
MKKTRFDPLARPEEFPEAPQPQCAECGDTGYIEEHQEGDPEGTTRARECSCVPRRRYEKRMELLDLENLRFKGLTLDTYEPENSGQREALEACRAWAEAWPRVERGILLMGPVGVGKTGLLWATAKAAGVKKRVTPKILRALELAEAPLFLERGESGMPTRNMIIERVVRRPLLVFDDLGTGKRSESADGAYFRLLDKRHLACAPTLVTTNYVEEAKTFPGGVIESIHSRIGSRLYSRLKQSCDFFDMTGADRRRSKSDG